MLPLADNLHTHVIFVPRQWLLQRILGGSVVALLAEAAACVACYCKTARGNEVSVEDCRMRAKRAAAGGAQARMVGKQSAQIRPGCPVSGWGGIDCRTHPRPPNRKGRCACEAPSLSVSVYA